MELQREEPRGLAPAELRHGAVRPQPQPCEREGERERPRRAEREPEAAAPEAGEARRREREGGVEGEDHRGGPPRRVPEPRDRRERSEEHTSELQSRENLVCRLLLEKKKK